MLLDILMKISEILLKLSESQTVIFILWAMIVISIVLIIVNSIENKRLKKEIDARSEDNKMLLYEVKMRERGVKHGE